jgi:hypothetical protein
VNVISLLALIVSGFVENCIIVASLFSVAVSYFSATLTVLVFFYGKKQEIMSFLCCFA